MKALSIVIFLSATLLTLGLPLGTPAQAEQRVNVNIPGGGAQDLLNMTTIPNSISDHSADPTLTRSCTNAEGRVVHQGEDEYRQCISATEGLGGGRKSQQPSANPNSHVITIQEQPPVD